MVWALFSFIRNFNALWLGQCGQSRFLRSAPSLVFPNKFVMNLRQIYLLFFLVALVQAAGCFSDCRCVENAGGYFSPPQDETAQSNLKYLLRKQGILFLNHCFSMFPFI